MRLSPVSRCGTWEEDRDLGMVAPAIMGGVNMGESSGSELWVVLLVSAIPAGFIRGDGTWVFLGSTSI